MHFADKILSLSETKQSVLCLGLDPDYSRIPEHLKKNASPDETFLKFLIPIIDACAESIVAVKPQLAYFEAFGSVGYSAFEKVCMFAKSRGLLVIVDGKRNDIGSTAEMYAEAYLGKGRPYDALTVNAYLGEDGVLPFVEKCIENEKGIFVLVKTSNPSAGEFQDLPVGDELLHETVARSVVRWGLEDMGAKGFSSIGAVVGATYPDEIRILRSEMPAQIFLVPGYGTQGGSVEDVIPAFYSRGERKGAIITTSRSILFAYEKENDSEHFAEYSAIVAENARRDLWEALS